MLPALPLTSCAATRCAPPRRRHQLPAAPRCEPRLHASQPATFQLTLASSLGPCPPYSAPCPTPYLTLGMIGYLFQLVAPRATSAAAPCGPGRGPQVPAHRHRGWQTWGKGGGAHAHGAEPWVRSQGAASQRGGASKCRPCATGGLVKGKSKRRAKAGNRRAQALYERGVQVATARSMGRVARGPDAGWQTHRLKASSLWEPSELGHGKSTRHPPARLPLKCTKPKPWSRRARPPAPAHKLRQQRDSRVT